VTLDQGYLFWKILPLKGEGGIEMNEKKKERPTGRKEEKEKKKCCKEEKKGYSQKERMIRWKIPFGGGMVIF